jgi:ubiquitin-protein ligase
MNDPKVQGIRGLPGITAKPHEDNYRYFDVTIQGPDGSPFESTFDFSFTLEV